MSVSSRTLWTPIGFTPERNEFPSMYLQQANGDKSLNSMQKRKQTLSFGLRSVKSNSHFFQKWVFIEGIRNPPRKLVVIQVPEAKLNKTLYFSLETKSNVKQ